MTASSDDHVSDGALLPTILPQRGASYLPLELWGQVLHQVGDDYTLWVNCRQVSRTFRAEAEREFTLTRLPLLKMDWYFHGEDEFEGRIYIHKYNVHDIKFQSLIEDGSRAQFSFSFEHTIKDAETLVFMDSFHWSQCEHFKDMLIETMASRHLDFEKRYMHRCESHRAELGCHIDETQITRLAVDIGGRTFSFDWEAFLNDFYQTTSYVQARKPSKETVSDLAERSLRNLRLPEYKYSYMYGGSYEECTDDWKREFGEEDDDCYAEAYLSRLRSVHNQAGLDFDLNNLDGHFRKAQFLYYTESRYTEMRWARNSRLLEDYCRRHKITEPLPDLEDTSTSNSDVAVVVGLANEVETVDGLDNVDQEDEAELGG